MKRGRPSSAPSPSSRGDSPSLSGLLLQAVMRQAHEGNLSPTQRAGRAELNAIKRCVSRKLGASTRQRVASMEDHIERARTSGSEWPVYVTRASTSDSQPDLTAEQRNRVKTRMLDHAAACARLARAVLDAPSVEAAQTLIHDDAVVGSHMREHERHYASPLHRYGHKLVLYAYRHAAERALYARVADLPPPETRLEPSPAADRGSSESELPTDF